MADTMMEHKEPLKDMKHQMGKNEDTTPINFYEDDARVIAEGIHEAGVVDPHKGEVLRKDAASK